uniref:Phthiocerol/phenolphthiocerol synthesis polyketide synthase type I PpsD-like n=1 Tax=Gouania willdenowi TaxID=441366 RepID=A0A8C5I1T5_GOUWI
MEDLDDEIAIVGIGCNFPGGDNLDDFWKVLLEGKNCVVDIPPERFDTTYWYDANESKSGKTQTSKAALIEGFNEFDYKYFGITELEADYMDPQQKLLLQCTYRALEDAGIAMESISGSRTGVYIGLMNRDFEMLRNNSADTISHYNCTGTAMSVAANRISFTFNLTGPSFAIDSACSSSLVALHVACRDCEMALCGGVNCIIEPRVFIALSKAKMISPEGTSKPFSSRADGYGRGEGCGVVLLKPLNKAIKDSNKIWGIISKTAVNQDARSVKPITKPSLIQQEELLRSIYSESDRANVQYIEAHGTGTPVGDPIEARSLSNVITGARPPGTKTLLIGSLKGNIGHTESAAGVAGLIKVLLMMKHEILAPTVYFSEDTAGVDFKALNLNILTKAKRWETNGLDGRVAGINNFGFGGTNAHAIVKEFKYAKDSAKIQTFCPNLFAISAASEKSLILSITDTHHRLTSSQTVDLQALVYTAACGRSHNKHKYRKALLTSSVSDLERQLSSTLKTNMRSTWSDVQVVFVFCGNGVAFRGMCKQLMEEFPLFREKAKEAETLFQKHTNINICGWLMGEHESYDLSKPDVVQPLLFVIQISIATLLKHWGIIPDAVLGHSVGEVAAAHCSGLLSLEDAVKVLHYRSNLQSKITGGKMLVVGNVAVEKILENIQAFSGRICMAALNSPQSCTLTGVAEDIDTLHQKLRNIFKDVNVFLYVLDVPTAYHSHMMDPILDDIERCIDVLQTNKMESKLFSTVTGNECSEGDFSTGRYWAKNIRQPVLFEQTLHAAFKEKQVTKKVAFVEIGPRGALQKNIHETLGYNTTVLSTAHPQNDCDTILSTLAKLFEIGVNVDWQHLYKGCEMLPTTFPVYQFDNVRKVLDFDVMRKVEEHSLVLNSHPLISHVRTDKKEFTCNLSMDTAPYLWEHKHNSVAIMPGAFYVELALASVMANLKLKVLISQLSLSVTFQSVLTLNLLHQKLTVTLTRTEHVDSFRIQSSDAVHASGTFSVKYQGPALLEEQTIALNTVTQRCTVVLTREEIYSTLSQEGFEYGSLLKQLDKVHFGKEFMEALTTIQVPGELLKSLHDYFIHPVLLDYFLQMTAVVAMGLNKGKQGFPSGIGSVVISGPLHKEMVMYLRATEETAEFLDVCGCFCTTKGEVLVELKSVKISFLGNCSHLQSLFFHNEIIPIDNGNKLETSKIRAIVFEDKLGIAKRLRPYVSSESVIVERKDLWKADQIRNLVCTSLKRCEELENVLFIWGVEDITHLACEEMLDCLVTCCEMLRQIVLGIKEIERSITVRVITYRSTGLTIDHVSPGFVLSGMVRACAAELADHCFQQIDLASVRSEDIQTLACVISTCKQQEIGILKGQASAKRIARTPITDKALCNDDKWSLHQRNAVFQTTDPYTMANFSAILENENESPLHEKSVEIELTNICVHSADYFPVSTSHLMYGKTMYWSKQSSHYHSLLALDFSGVVTSVGKDVHNLKVGEHVASCCPVAAAGKIRIPEELCYRTNNFPFLKETPCLSYFILSWVILQGLPSEGKRQHSKLTIISSNLDSALIKVLALAASRSGWIVSARPHFMVESSQFDDSSVFIFLPYFDLPLQEMYDNCDLKKHMVFVYSNQMAPFSRNMCALKSDHVFVHKLDVDSVFQRSYLLAQNKKITNWLRFLDFNIASFPLRKEFYQSSSIKGSQSSSYLESYFTTKAVQQIVLDNRAFCGLEFQPHFQAGPRHLFKQGCVYIVTGGLTGLGFETVKFIAQNGGSCIATLSRGCPSKETQFQMNVLQKKFDVTIIHAQCDVSVSMHVVEAISKIKQRFPSCPIKGVFHSAAVLHDALIESLDESLFRKVLGPKVCGVLNLHHVTLNSKLDYFVCYSSISSFIGNASQCNYASANSFLDEFCNYRKNLGLAGQSVNWGPLNLGLLLNKGHFQKFLEAKGMMTLNVWEVHDALKMCLLMNTTQQVICKFNFRNLNIHILSQNASLRERLSTLVAVELEGQSECKDQIVPSTHENVKTMVANVIDVSADELDDDSTLSALGVDSMLAMTLQNTIFQDTGVNVPLVIILDPNTTLDKLVTVVSQSKLLHVNLKL